MKDRPRFLITCEHAAAEVPAILARKIHIRRNELVSHKAFDRGALELAQELRELLKGDLHYFPITRLLIDANRNLEGGKALAKSTRKLASKELDWLIQQYLDYRRAIFQSANQIVKSHLLCAVSVHTFVARINGVTRSTDIGLLFRPTDPKEKLLAQLVRTNLKKIFPDLKIHFNLPYRGHTDCLLNDLSNKFQRSATYVALFLEINQRLLLNQAKIRRIATGLAKGLTDASIGYISSSHSNAGVQMDGK